MTRSAFSSVALSSCVVPPAPLCGTPPRLAGSTFCVVAPEHAHVTHVTRAAVRTLCPEPYVLRRLARLGPPPDAIA